MVFVLLVLLAIIVLVFFWIVGTYNGLIVSKNRVDNAWSQIDVQLQRRFDLIPNLVETVKGYKDHEKEVFDNIAKARAQMSGAQTISEKGEASTELSGSLNRLLAISEAYPELKANENFLELQRELKGTEDKIAFSRQFYNDSVTRFNSKIELFPTNIFANMFNMIAREYFAVDSKEARGPVKVKF